MIIYPGLVRHKYLFIMRHLIRTDRKLRGCHLIIAEKKLRFHYASMLSPYPAVIISDMYMTWVVIDHEVLLFPVF